MMFIVGMIQVELSLLTCYLLNRIIWIMIVNCKENQLSFSYLRDGVKV